MSAAYIRVAYIELNGFSGSEASRRLLYKKREENLKKAQTQKIDGEGFPPNSK